MTARSFLLFQLAGPMAAFGDIAVGEQRSLWDAPSKSAVLGFVAGAVGVTREESDMHRALDDGLGFAVRIDDPGLPLRDYHTAQAPKARKNSVWRTRKEELGEDKGDLTTILSDRIYRLHAAATIALWRKTDDGPALERLRDAIRRPRFAPYLGRKACPLGWPPSPRLVEAAGLNAAFQAYDALEGEMDSPDDLPLRPGASGGVRVIWFEWGAGLHEEEQHPAAVRLRRDAIRDRALWQFTDRREGRLVPAAASSSESVTP